jgi:SpoVK/Ycf46/Vps4 family AAA+-type ATPase
MIDLKQTLCCQIITVLYNFHENYNFNTIVSGDPGTGKTTICNLIANLYYQIGIVKSPQIYNINKSDLVGTFCGSTVQKTQSLIDKVDEEGAVFYIDEVYSIGYGEKTDLFSKECIDVLCQNLLIKKNIVFIVSGYKEDIQKNFLDINPGLKRRFFNWYHLPSYNKEQLYKIFLQKLQQQRMKHDLQKKKHFNNTKFYNNAGDMDILLQHVQMIFLKKNFGKNIHQEYITDSDIDEALNYFKNKDFHLDYFI